MDNIALRKQKWIDFADVSTNVNRLLVIDCTEDMPKRPMLWWENMKQREDWTFERFIKQMENVSVIHDNTIPFMTMITGTEIFAEAFGCSVYKPNNNNPCAIPRITNWRDVKKIRIPKLEDTKLVNLFEAADRLSKRAGKDALFGLPDIQTPMDIAALIWDKSDFYAAMYDAPEAVKELSEKVKIFMFDFLDEWFKRFGREFIAHFPDYYMPFGVSVSEDEIGSVSADIYKEFFEKELLEFSSRYGAIGVHCCADSMHQWGNLSNIPNLKILNLVRDCPQTVQSLKFFRDVCGQYPTSVIRDLSEIEEPQKLHLAQHISVDSRDKAAYTADYFNEYGVLPQNI